MNERIRELAEQAGFTVENGHIQSLAYKQTEKLAELIVRECCQKLENDGMVEVAMEMKEHFGVE